MTKPRVYRPIYALKMILKCGITKHNVTHLSWEDIIVNHGMPFLKIDLLRDNYLRLPNVVLYKDVISQHGEEYPVGLIDAHLSRVLNRNRISN